MLCPECKRENVENARFCSECGHKIYVALPAGTLLHNNRYEVKSPIKHGAMGALYEIWDFNLEKHFALKAMNPAFTDSDDLKKAEERFRNEAKLLSELSHPGLPRVIDYFPEEGIYYLVMDLIEGDDFEEILEEKGKPGLSESIVKQTAMEILDILQYLHSQDPPILYRDLKPSNIMKRDSDGKIMLVDFGIAKTMQKTPVKTGTKMGTEGYAPPEQYRGKAEIRSDIYSLGATMHHLLTGTLPTPFNFDSLKTITPAISSSLIAIVHRAIEIDPADRFQSAEQMKQALKGKIKVISMIEKKSPRASMTVMNKPTTVPPLKTTTQLSKNASTARQSSVKVTTAPGDKNKNGWNDFTLFLFLMAPVMLLAFIVVGLFFMPGIVKEKNYKSAMEAYNNHKYKDAVKHFDSVLKQDRENPKIYLYLGKSYLEDNRYDKAIRNFQIALKKDKDLEKEIAPLLAMAYYKNGEAKAEKGLFKAAASDFYFAFKTDPTLKKGIDPRVLYYRGLLSQRDKNHPEAIEFFTESLKNTKNPGVLLSRAESYIASGDIVNAKSDMDQVLRMNPELKNRVNELSAKAMERIMEDINCRLNEQKYKEAQAFIDEYRALFGNSGEINKLEGEALVGLANNYLSYQEYDEALKYLNRVLKNNPRQADAYYYKGEANYRKENFNKAIEYYKKAQELDPKKYSRSVPSRIRNARQKIEYEKRRKASGYYRSNSTPKKPVTVSRKGLQEYKILVSSREPLVSNNKKEIYILNYKSIYPYLKKDQKYWGKLQGNQMTLYIPGYRGNEEAKEYEAKKLEKIKVSLITRKKRSGRHSYFSGSTVTLKTEKGSTLFIEVPGNSNDFNQGATYKGIVTPSEVTFYIGSNYRKKVYKIKGFAGITR